MQSFVPQENKTSPKVAIIYGLNHPGGVQSVVLSLIKGLNQHDIVPDMVWDTPPNPSMLAGKGVRAGFKYIRLPVPSKKLDQVPKTIKYILRMPNVIASQHLNHAYDFLYIFYNGFIVNDYTPHVRFLNGPPLLPQLDKASPGLRGLPYRFLRWLYHSMLHNIFPVYDYHRDSASVINAQYTADLFYEAHGVRLPVVHPPIDISGRTFTLDDLDQRDTITYFSRFVDYKRPEMVLALASRYPQQRVVLMGGVKPQETAYFEGLRARANQERLDNVHFFANPPDHQVREELRRTRFYVFPGVNEHFGMTTVEAIASGAIPFVHDSGGQREIVPDMCLRFSDATFFDQFSELHQLSMAEHNQIRQKLRNHIRGFSEDVFNQKMLAFLDLPLEREKENELQITTA